MASTQMTDYVLRFNSTLNRKELLRRGYQGYVSGGGPITPGTPLAVTLSPSNANPAPGATVTLTATVTGGVAPYVTTFTPPAGVTLSGSGLTRTFTAPTSTTALTFRVSSTDQNGDVQEASCVVTPTGAVSASAKFAGHTPNRVKIGIAAVSGPPPYPGWTEARNLLGGTIYEARRFTSSWISLSEFDSMVSEADSANALPWISFKVDTGGTTGWQQVRDKAKDAALINLFNYCKDYLKPILCTIHHEPSGDGDLATWAQMQEYCAWFFAGYRNVTYNSTTGQFTKGTYNAANDLTLNNNGNFTWASIGNGFWWRPTTPLAEADIAYPAQLITALTQTKSLLGNDFYDVNYANPTLANTDPTARVAGTGVRTSTRISHFITWARAKGVAVSGIGEYGCIDGAELTRCWQVLRANRDLMAVANYFDSMSNSDHDWRLIPSDYPSHGTVTASGLVDTGGDANSQGRLDAFVTTLNESVSAQYTSPL